MRLYEVRLPEQESDSEAYAAEIILEGEFCIIAVIPKHWPCVAERVAALQELAALANAAKATRTKL